MIQYKAFEMHTHTVHSDGKFTVADLQKAAKECLLDGVLLTDHNTMSGERDLPVVAEKDTVPVIVGIEWTTFFGHMLIIGAESYIDWRYVLPDTIDTYVDKIRKVNGVVGIAHPFAIGSPMCTGCYWNFKIRRWDNINYIEVWSQTNPTALYENRLAFLFWTELLNSGYKIAATSGTDWHWKEEHQEHTAVTYLGLDEGIVTTDTIRDAIKAGRTFVTAGPVIQFSIQTNGKKCELGETIKAGAGKVIIRIDQTRRRNVWDSFEITGQSVNIVSNGKTVSSVLLSDRSSYSLEIEFQPGWIRAELYGDILDKKNQLLGFTSPIYVK